MDFYFKYRDYVRKLCSTFRHKGITLNVYRVTVPNEMVTKYVLTKNRKVILERFEPFIIENKFLDCIYLEFGASPELFNH